MTNIKYSLTIELAEKELELEGTYKSDGTASDGTLEVGLSERCLTTLDEEGGFELEPLANALAESLGIGSIVDPVKNAFRVTNLAESDPESASLYITKLYLEKSDASTKLTLGLRIKFRDSPPELLGIKLTSLGVEVSVP